MGDVAGYVGSLAFVDYPDRDQIVNARRHRISHGAYSAVRSRSVSLQGRRQEFPGARLMGVPVVQAYGCGLPRHKLPSYG